MRFSTFSTAPNPSYQVRQRSLRHPTAGQRSGQQRSRTAEIYPSQTYVPIPVSPKTSAIRGVLTQLVQSMSATLRTMDTKTLTSISERLMNTRRLCTMQLIRKQWVAPKTQCDRNLRIKDRWDIFCSNMQQRRGISVKLSPEIPRQLLFHLCIDSGILVIVKPTSIER